MYRHNLTPAQSDNCKGEVLGEDNEEEVDATVVEGHFRQTLEEREAHKNSHLVEVRPEEANSCSPCNSNAHTTSWTTSSGISHDLR